MHTNSAGCCGAKTIRVEQNKRDAEGYLRVKGVFRVCCCGWSHCVGDSRRIDVSVFSMLTLAECGTFNVFGVYISYGVGPDVNKRSLWG